MKKFTKIAAAVISAVLMSSTVSALAFESAINVTLNGIVDNDIHYVSFGETRPIQINDSTFVPIRRLAESAGMTVTWDEPNKTALISLKANAASALPAERYAAAIISKIGGYGLELVPSDITAEMKLNDNNAVIRYNFIDTDGDTVAIGKTITMDSAATMLNETLMIPLRNSMEIFGLYVDWNQDTLTADISIPSYVSAPKGLSIIANYSPGVVSSSSSAPIVTETVTETVSVEENDPVDTNPALGQYLGRFKITHYCTCSECNGGWGNTTAWAGEIIPGQTIAVDPTIIGKLRWVYIDGYGIRRAEDCGGAVKGYHIDVAVSDHHDYEGVTYKDVYYLAE